MSEMQIVDQSLKNKEDINSVIDTNNEDSELNQLIKENLALTKEVASMVRHINKYVAWQRIFGWIKALFVVIPVIVGAIYLPPLFKDIYQQLMSILG